MILVLASLWALPRVEFDFSLIPILESNEEVKHQVEEFESLFPPGVDVLSCVLEWPRPVTEAELAFVAELGRGFEQLEAVDSVRSLATVDVVQTEGGLPRARNFLSVESGEPILERVRRHPLLERRLLSNDGRSLPIVIVAAPEISSTERSALLRSVRELTAKHVDPEVNVRFLGGEVVEEAMGRTMRRDMATSFGLEALFAAILLPILFRTFRGLAVPIGVMLSAVAMNFGLMVLMGRPVTILGQAIPGLILIIGLCDAIHMVHRFEESFAATRDKRRAIIEMMEKVGKACFLTSFTTSVGFLSLSIARHSGVRGFSISATLAVMLTFCVVITVLPLMLSYWPVRSAGRGMLGRLSRLSYGRVRLTLALFSGGVAFSVWGITRIVVDSSWLGELPQDSTVVGDLTWYEENLSGLLDLEAKIEGELDSVEAVEAIRSLQNELVAMEGVTGAESYVDWVGEMAGSPPDMDFDQIASGLAYLKLSGDYFPRHILAPDFSYGRIIFHTRDVGTRRFFEIQDALERKASELPPMLSVEPAGYSRMAYEGSRLVVITLMRSLLISMGAITLFVIIGYRSLRLGLISILPNVLPIVVALGLTGWLGMPMRIGIVMIYCLGVGLAVDDSIHLITRFVQERAENPWLSNRDVLLRCLRTTGRALITTSLLLGVGGLCFLTSSFRVLADTGILMMAIVTAALVSDLYLLPIMLERFMPEPKANSGGGSPRVQ